MEAKNVSISPSTKQIGRENVLQNDLRKRRLKPASSQLAAPKLGNQVSRPLAKNLAIQPDC